MMARPNGETVRSRCYRFKRTCMFTASNGARTVGPLQARFILPEMSELSKEFKFAILLVFVTEDYTCPFCSLECASYKGLECHLPASHDLFNYEFLVLSKRPPVTQGLSDIAFLNDGMRVRASDTSGAISMWDRRASDLPQRFLTTKKNKDVTLDWGAHKHVNHLVLSPKSIIAKAYATFACIVSSAGYNPFLVNRLYLLFGSAIRRNSLHQDLIRPLDLWMMKEA